MFLVVLTRDGPQWAPSRPLEEQSDWLAHAAFMDALVDAGVIVLGGPLGDEHRVAHAIEAESVDAVRAALARDPWERDASPRRHDRPVDDPPRPPSRVAKLGRAQSTGRLKICAVAIGNPAV